MRGAGATTADGQPSSVRVGSYQARRKRTRPLVQAVRLEELFHLEQAAQDARHGGSQEVLRTRAGAHLLSQLEKRAPHLRRGLPHCINTLARCTIGTLHC